ncbi:hypothetical protein [Phenylobacterium sp.]|uniref:hypothetical protein n=1 Tax=Phenylobacterium sp. TaxID=1871053 RepID=UPI0025EFE79B|nr:hypothetical protein [Phenylobacterium sp.]
MDRLLQGLAVLEATRGVAARYCGRLFAQPGAPNDSVGRSAGAGRSSVFRLAR